MSESYFAKLANEILDASEKLTTRFEEGLNILLGELDSSKSGSSGDTVPPPTDNEFEGWEDAEGMDDASPLAGIAESVMGDIMASQVCNVGLKRSLKNDLCRTSACFIATPKTKMSSEIMTHTNISFIIAHFFLSSHRKDPRLSPSNWMRFDTL